MSRVSDLILHSWPVQTAGAALIVALVTLSVTLVTSRKRIAWRVQAIDVFERVKPSATARPKVDFTVTVDGARVPDRPQLVLLRIRNSGFVPLKPGDFSDLLFTFPGRKVYSADVIETEGIAPVPRVELNDAPEDEPAAPATPEKRLRRRRKRDDPTAPPPASAASSVVLRAFAFNNGSRLVLRVVLAGPPVDKAKATEDRGRFLKFLKYMFKGKVKDEDTVELSAQIHGGKIDPEPPRHGPSSRSVWLGAGVALPLAGLLAGLFLSPAPAAQSTTSMACPKGSLVLVGSTAFASIATALAGQYEQACHNVSSITVSNAAPGAGTFNGLNDLVRSGLDPSLMAMADGSAPAGGSYGPLVGTPLGVIIFTVVVNAHTSVYNLTSAQVREMFAGRITSWRQLGGADLPVVIVSRDSDSGSRRAFDQYVLAGGERGPSSHDCVVKDINPRDPVLRCEAATTGELLDIVARTPGAIGFADTGDVSSYGNDAVQQVRLDGIDDRFADLGSAPGTYQFWTVEYLYTYGTPARDSLAAQFLAFMTNGTAKDQLRSHLFTPCVDQGQNLMATLCSPLKRRA